jgi:20S proteasome subunit beta 6
MLLKSVPCVENVSVNGLDSTMVSGLSERHGWSPYQNNEGTTLAVAGKDYCVVAGDSRMSDGYTILSRDVPKLFKLTSHTVLATAGMQADSDQLRRVLSWKITQYRHAHNKEMSTTSVAQMLGNTLYYKRFFPYYTFNVVAGIDSNGVGAVYGYDAIGSFERLPYCVNGSGTQLITPILDNQVGFKTHPSNMKDLSLQECIDLVKDVMTCAGERDMYTGDSVNICIITKEGIKEEIFQLKKD